MTDRPATEPRTPTGRAYLAELNGEKEPPEEWRDARGYLPKASRRAWEHDRDMILAIEAEAASPTALDVPGELRKILTDHGYQLEDTGEWWARSAGDWILSDVAALHARLTEQEERHG